jgi:hypothetical protein
MIKHDFNFRSNCWRRPLASSSCTTPCWTPSRWSPRPATTTSCQNWRKRFSRIFSEPLMTVQNYRYVITENHRRCTVVGGGGGLEYFWQIIFSGGICARIDENSFWRKFLEYKVIGTFVFFSHYVTVRMVKAIF